MQLWLENELHQLDPIKYSILLLLMAGLSLFLFYRSYRAYHRFRFMDGTATSKIRSASQGYVELKGLGEWMPGDQIYSPFSGSRCLWFHCTIEKKQVVGKRQTWVNVSNQKSDQLFHLIDETGECVIDPEDAHIVPELKRSWYGSSSADQSIPQPTRQGWFASYSVGFGPYRFKELLIRPATQIYALGYFQTHRLEPGESLINRQVEELIREWKLKPGKYLCDYDVDRNGKIEGREWVNIRSAARRAVMASNLKEDKPQNLLSKPATSKQPYILSALTEDELVSHKKLLSLTSLVPAFILFCTVMLCVTIRPPF